ncbi:hypothetical protein ACN28S_16765 [Cystobacter fuscus]
MKNSLLLVLALLALPSCKKDAPIPDGFKGAKLGMTRGELKRTVPAATEQGDYFILTGVEYAGLPARAGLVFNGTDKLQYIFFEFTKEHGGFDQYEEAKKRLTEEFGKPIREESNMLAWRTIWGGNEGGNAVMLEQSGPLGDGSFSLVLASSETLLRLLTPPEK